MKIKQYLEDFLTEENIIGTLENGTTIGVYQEPLKNPSFHIRSGDGGKHIVFLMKDFSVIERKTKGFFSHKELKEVSRWFSEKSELPEYTNWQILIANWNTLNSNKLPLSTPQPKI